jgi:cytochrome P450
MNRDPEVYGQNANDFYPERHLNDQNGDLKLKDDSDEGHFTFSLGGRSV